MSENLVSWWTFVWWAECGLSWAAGLSEPRVRGSGVRGSGDIECFMKIPDIGRSVKPISTKLVDYAYHITTCTPGFSDLPTALVFAAGRVIMINLGCQASRRILPFLYLDVSPLTYSNSLDLFAKAHLLSPFVQENRSMDTFSRKIVLKSMWIIIQLNRIKYYVRCRKFHRSLRWTLNNYSK